MSVKRGLRACDGGIDIGGFAEHELARTLARRGVEHRLRARGRAVHALAVNVVNDVGGVVERCGHARLLKNVWAMTAVYESAYGLQRR